MKHVQARWFHQGRRKAVRLIVTHCTVSPESPTGAEAVAAYFARGERRASAHRVADNNSVVSCVFDGDTAFAAAGANSDGIHMELVGHADQSDAEWNDDYSLATIVMAGPSMREWARDYAIPARWLTVDQVRDGVSKGFCTHADVSRAFPEVSTGHWDPGPNFPKARAMAIWFPPTPPPAPKDHTMFSYEYEPEPNTPNHLVLVENGKQIRLTGADLLKRRRAAVDSHFGQVGTDEVSRFRRVFGPIIE